MHNTAYSCNARVRIFMVPPAQCPEHAAVTLLPVDLSCLCLQTLHAASSILMACCCLLLLLLAAVLQLDDLRAGSDTSDNSRSKVKQDQLSKLVGSSSIFCWTSRAAHC